MRYRVGRYTTGISLILIGLFTLLSQTMEYTWMSEWPNFWPLILIGYGIEYLMVSRREARTSFDVGGAITVAVLFVVTTSFTVFSGVFGWGDFGGDRYTFEDPAVIVSAGEISAVYADTTNGKVIVSPASDNKVTVVATYHISANSQGEAEKRKREIKVDVHEEGSRLIVKVKHPRRTGFNFNISAVNLEILAPSHLNLHVDTTNGMIEVEGMDNIGKLDTTNGKIIVRNSKGNAKLDTTNGSIEVVDFVGGLKADTTNGAIFASGKLSDDWKLDTTNGKVEVSIPGDGSYAYDISTMVGSVHVPDGFLPGQQGKREYKGIYNGGEYGLVIDTTNGSIHVNFR